MFKKILLLTIFICSISYSQNSPSFNVSFSNEICSTSLDGRLLLMISDDGSKEPRFQINEGPNTQLIFGIDIEGLNPDEDAVIDKNVFGYPLESISLIPKGEYWVQALIHKYETFHRSDGKVVKLPMDRGEGQQWNKAPGNIYSVPVKVNFDPNTETPIKIEINKIIPPIQEAPDTKYIKHIKIKSEILSKFWGRPMYLGAHILLPEGFDEHPDAKYPLVINHGHYPHTFGGFRETPPDTTQAPVYSTRFDWEGYNITQEEYAYKFYKEWTGPDFPRFLIIEIQHPTPYYDDSYAVNSENLGPYGDAITYELIPFIEKKFRGIGEGWARFLYGGSTGGWESLAAQVFYPDEYNGCFAACPDPVDFRAYMIVNIYEDENAFYTQGKWKKVPRPASRNYLGKINSTIEDGSHFELVLGSNGRSGQQLDIWQAVYGPVNDDGYPKEIWNKRTGVIDKSVAEYWKENYDLRYILERDWDKIGKKLEGKINVYCGDMDNYYLNNAVYLLDEFLETTREPYYGGEIDYGDRAEHCWNGDHTQPNGISRLRYHQMFAPKIVERILKTAPEGADTTSWRY